MADVGEALAGPFDKYLNEWDKMRRRTDLEDRTNEPYPWWAPEGRGEQPEFTPTPMEHLERILDRVGPAPENIPAPTRLSIDAGAKDIGPLPKEEVLKWLIGNEMHNPPPPAPSIELPGPIPLPRIDPRKAGNPVYPNDMTREEYSKSLEDFSRRYEEQKRAKRR